jgi:DNA polymerase-3 subunit delta
MTYPELKRALETGNFPPLLFLYGEERFFLERAVNLLREAAVPAEARDFNFNLYHARESRAEAILDNAATLPVFSPHRLVLVKDAQHFPASELDKFLPYLKDPAPETTLAFTSDKIDGRKKFFQEFRKRGQLVEFKKLYDNQIPACVKELARESGFSFTEDALALFSKRVGTNLQEIHGELSKLRTFIGDKRLADVADVGEIVSDARVDSIFDLTNALGRRDHAQALLLLNRLLDEGMAPLLLLSMMVRHFRQLWITRELLDQGVGRKDMPGRIGVNPYFLDGLIAQARRFSSNGYRGAFELFLETDLALKSSGAHPTPLLEKLVLNIAGQEIPE